MIHRKLHSTVNCYCALLLLLILLPVDLHAQIKTAVETDLDYLLSKYSYTYTNNFEKVYCNLYPNKFYCDKIDSAPRGMFPEEFDLTDRFFVKLALRPVGKENYNALNIAGLYLREKRPDKKNRDFVHAFLDVELDTITRWLYTRSDVLDSKAPEVEKFKLAYLKFLEENLFLITDITYSNELKASNNFKGGYYDFSRSTVLEILRRLLTIEKSPVVLEEIKKLINKVPEKYRDSYR